MSGNVTTAKSTISAISPSTFIAEKNAFTQNPIVRLYSIYYPGEWYPPNKNGNPSGPGEGRAWPSGFPIRIAEIVGDIADDISYNVTYAGTSYQPFPVNISGIEQNSDGKINDLSLTLFNVDNMISVLVEDPNLLGNNTSNAVMATVNGELVHGLDPRTVNASPADVGVPGSTAYNALELARSQGLLYDESVVSQYGTQNSSFTYDQAVSVNGNWLRQRADSRDLLGGVVEIKTTFANFLDYWPEHSKVTNTYTNTSISTITINNAAPYRIGDYVQLQDTSSGLVTSIVDNSILTINKTLTKYKYIGSKEGGVRGLYLAPASNLLYLVGTSTDTVYQYPLINYDDISSASSPTSKSVAAQDSAPSSIALNPSGNTLYVLGTTNKLLHSYNLSNVWNVQSASLVANANIQALTSETTPVGFCFNDTGTKLYTVGTVTDNVYQLSLSVPWDITTATLETYKYVGTQESSPYSISFNTSGDKLFVMGTAGDDINQYNLSESWNVASAAYSRVSGFNGLDGTLTAHTWSSDGSSLYIAGQVTDNVYQFSATEAWNVATLTSSADFADKNLFIINSGADTESYLEDKFRIDQLEGLSDHVATFGLTSWLQYFKMIVPRRKFYKNTCQWVYKSAECQYPGPGGLPIPGTTLLSTKPYNLKNEETTIKSHSLLSWTNWVVGTGAVTGYTANGDGNSRIKDQTPYNERNIVWDVSNQDATSDADGGWNTSFLAIDNSKMYRFSVWIRRKTIGNGSTYLGTNGLNSSSTNIGILQRDTGAVDTNPYFATSSWGSLSASDWYLFVGHVWPLSSGTGSTHVDSGIYKMSSLGTSSMIANKLPITRDFIWQTGVVSTNHRAYLYYSTNTSTNQQFYQPRIDICDGNEPSIADLLTYSGEQLLARGAEDICSKSLAACTLRNNNIHYGGFPGVGRTIPRA